MEGGFQAAVAHHGERPSGCAMADSHQESKHPVHKHVLNIKGNSNFITYQTINVILLLMSLMNVTNNKLIISACQYIMSSFYPWFCTYMLLCNSTNDFFNVIWCQVFRERNLQISIPYWSPQDIDVKFWVITKDNGRTIRTRCRQHVSACCHLYWWAEVLLIAMTKVWGGDGQ